MKAAPNPYDAVAYPGHPNPQTFPDRMAAMALLHGLTPARVERCRVLEIACGDGSNLIPMAYAMPESEFVGFDLARLPIERGLDQIRELGLKNIHLFQQDLLEAGAELGRFDFMIAHGVYAWIPEPVRDRLLALCGALLAENGVAFVSYSAMPGGHLRSMAREMMRFATRGVEDPLEQVAEGFKFLEFLVERREDGDLYRALLDDQAKRMRKRAHAATRHDEMTDAYHPVYFSEFIEHAARHGLQYLSEAELPPPPDPCYSGEIQTALQKAAGGDALRQEQLLDFVRMRVYRETLLCRADRAVMRDFAPENFRRLLFASQTKPAPGNAAGATAFVLPGGIRMESNHPGVTTFLLELGKVWPHALSFHAMEPMLAGKKLALDQDGVALIFRLAVARMIELRSWNAPVADSIGERPMASACSRQEARLQTIVTSLLHGNLSVDDAKVRSLLLLLDGTRDRTSLLQAMKAEFPAIAAEEIETGLDGSLRLFHAAGVLEA